ncbi:MAG: hypothetical protein A2Z14_16855 [Chloroflexi bacterium RBG_16_48_8]|nr:MAG: hypothetical protein A2Z14_16855 [Chloroflexi bacterium RBG_16_48_8]
MSLILTTTIELVTAITGMIALLLIVLQLRQQTKQQRFEALSQVHKEVAEPEFRNALQAVFSKDPEALASTTSFELKRSIDDATAVYDLVGLRIQEGVLPKEATLKTEWKILVPLWRQVEGYVKSERERRGMPYKEHFEWLAKEAEKYRSRHYPESTPKVVKYE